MARPVRRLDGASEFGRRLRERRLALGLSQMRVAELANLHFTYVSSVERGERNLSLENILRLAAAVETDPCDLVRGLQASRN